VSTSAEPGPRHRLIGTRAEGIALLLLTAFLWGFGWPQIKFLLTELPPFTARSVSYVSGVAIAFGVAWALRETLLPPRGQWGWLVIYAMLNIGLFTIGTTLALVWLSASEAVVITYTLPVWAAILAWPLLGERPSLRTAAAIMLAVAGVALLVGVGWSEPVWGKLPGVLSGFSAAILFALGTVIAKRHPLALPPVTGVAWQAGIGTVPLVVWALFEHPQWERVTPMGFVAGGYIAVMPLTVAYLAWFRALRFVPASLAATTVLISPLVGVLTSALLLGDPLGPRQLVALAMTLSGVALAARK